MESEEPIVKNFVTSILGGILFQPDGAAAQIIIRNVCEWLMLEILY